jgi:transcriptional regulator with XRE-family HTH domain
LWLREAIDDYNERLPAGAEPMTQRRLAELVGVTEGIVSKHANGHVFPMYSLILRYADVLGVAVDRLIRDDRSMQGAA